MTASLDRAPETAPKLGELPGDAHLAAAALHLLLATRAELVDLPIRWEIEAGIVSPRLPHGDERTAAMAHLLATALELPLHSSPFTATNGDRMEHIWSDGRWGGAEWRINAYVGAEGGEQPC
jgi:hypothetical protein